MTTRIEQATERIALAVLQNISDSVESALNVERLEKHFYAQWPRHGSKFPMNAAMRAAIAGIEGTSRGFDESKGTWKTSVIDAFNKAVSNAVEEYFNQAQDNFAKAQPLAATEALTDAVVSALCFIAATREWPHATETDLHNAAIALAAGRLPKDPTDAYELLGKASEDGLDLCSALAAAMGQPESVRFGLFYDSRDGSDEDAMKFAKRTVTLARNLAGEAAVPF